MVPLSMCVQSGETALMAAAREGHTAIVQLLLEANADNIPKMRQEIETYTQALVVPFLSITLSSIPFLLLWICHL
jgi:ankyrin repeat protein